MAVTITPGPVQGPNIETFDIEATADGDTSAFIAHTLGNQLTVSGLIYFAKISPAPDGVQNASDWGIVSVSGTQIHVSKNNVVNSGQAGIQVRVTAMLPHSMIR